MKKENGTLIIVKGKKGFNAKISFVKPDGKTSEMPVLGYKPTDDKYNNTECAFRRDRGQLIELIAHDGTVLLGAKTQPSSSGSTGKQQHQQQEGISDSYDPSAAFLPGDVREILNRMGSPDNFSLKLNKVARFDKRMNKFQFFKRERKGENYEIKEHYGKVDFKQIAEREYANARSFLGDNNIHRLELTTDWRMVQGLGIESVYETSLTLHHIYGIPYIPASALKGVVRNWVITKVYGTDEGAATRDQKFCDWFGCPAEIIDGKKQKSISYYKESRQGNLVFFDVFPLTPPKVVADVMNPHYHPYYSDNSGKVPPADYLSPNPVFFLTIANTTFQVLVGGRKKEMLQATIGGKDIQYWLREALTSHGIGAKTAVGYGYFKPS